MHGTAVAKPESPRHPTALLTLAFAVVVAILPTVVPWQIETQGIVLLVLTALLAYVLMKVPHKSYYWKVQPGTDFAMIKQTIGTMRTIVSILLALLVFALLCTSESIVGRLPDAIANVMAPAISGSSQPGVVALRLDRIPKTGDGSNMFLGRIDAQATAAVNAAPDTPSPGAAAAPPESVEKGNVIYVVGAPTIMRRVLEGSFLPSLFQYAWLMWFLCALSVGCIFMMETIGNINWDKARPEPSTGE